MPIELGSFSVGAIAGGALIGVANHFLSKSRNREDREITDFNEAATAFTDAFRHEISFLRYNIGIDGLQSTDCSISQFLHAGMVQRHTEALVAFRKHLTENQRHRIDYSWDEYKKQIVPYKHVPMPEHDKVEALGIIEAFLDKHAKIK